jgi:hypothetical protein
MMRIDICILAAIITFVPAPVFAQQCINYFDYEQRFSVNLPAEPIIEDASIVSQRGDVYPARIYRANDGTSLYMVKVVDYTLPDVSLSEDEAIVDVRGAVSWEARRYRNATVDAEGEIKFDGYAELDGIEGHRLMIANADQSRSFVSIHLLSRRLYVFEASIRGGGPPPTLFQASRHILDENGGRARFEIDADGQRQVREQAALH